MRPNAVGTFKRPLAGAYVYKKFVWVFIEFIEMLRKNIFLSLKTLKKSTFVSTFATTEDSSDVFDRN